MILKYFRDVSKEILNGKIKQIIFNVFYFVKRLFFSQACAFILEIFTHLSQESK